MKFLDGILASFLLFTVVFIVLDNGIIGGETAVEGNNKSVGDPALITAINAGNVVCFAPLATPFTGNSSDNQPESANQEKENYIALDQGNTYTYNGQAYKMAPKEEVLALAAQRGIIDQRTRNIILLIIGVAGLAYAGFSYYQFIKALNAYKKYLGANLSSKNLLQEMFS